MSLELQRVEASVALREVGFSDGAVFRPYKRFREVLVIPQRLAAHSGFSPGAKLVYGVLSKHAGERGACFPSMQTIGKSIGVTERWAAKLVGELVTGGLLVKTRGGKGRSNRYHFVWRSWLDLPNRIEDPYQNDSQNGDDLNDPSCVDLNASSDLRGTILPPKRFKKENNLEKKDLDYPLRGPEFDVGQSASKEEAELGPGNELRDVVTRMFREPSKDEILRIVAKTPNLKPEEALEAIRSADFRGYNSEHKHAPGSISWFESVVTDHFEQKVRRCSPPMSNLVLGKADEENEATVRLTPQQSLWFEEFWQMYWRTEQKLKAAKAFAEQITNEELWEGCKLYLQHEMDAMLDRDEEFRPYAAKWLRGEDFLDELHPARFTDVEERAA